MKKNFILSDKDRKLTIQCIKHWEEIVDKSSEINEEIPNEYFDLFGISLSYIESKIHISCGAGGCSFCKVYRKYCCNGCPYRIFYNACCYKLHYNHVINSKSWEKFHTNAKKMLKALQEILNTSDENNEK